MNVKPIIRRMAKIVPVLWLMTMFTPTQASAEQIDDNLVVGSQTLSGYAQVISTSRYTVEHFIFYPTDGGLEHLSSGYGSRKKACGACSSWHIGADFTAGYGGDVRAVTAGVVKYVGWQSGSGFVIVLRHPVLGNVETVYAHLISKSNTVSVGDEVEPNQVIAKIGQTGVTTAPHLHLEVWVNDYPVNPVTWLKKNKAQN
jgi:murein DD-endopeptidase MepM/ murein hydrolase activator NlpD